MIELIKAGMAEYGYKRGREDERKEWVDSVLPETMQITIKIRNKEDKVEQIRVHMTFDEIKSAEAFPQLFEVFYKRTLEEIALHKDGILADLLKEKHI